MSDPRGTAVLCGPRAKSHADRIDRLDDGDGLRTERRASVPDVTTWSV
jgi:hypothetical protein